MDNIEKIADDLRASASFAKGDDGVSAVLFKHYAERLEALSHAAGQDGEQCRAASVASGEVDDLIDELENMGEQEYDAGCCNANYPIAAATRCMRDAAKLLRALSRGVPEGMVLVPKVPTQEMLAVIRDEQFPEDWNAGKQLQASAGFDVVPPECGIEIAAGQYVRLLAIAAQRKEG